MCEKNKLIDIFISVACAQQSSLLAGVAEARLSSMSPILCSELSGTFPWLGAQDSHTFCEADPSSVCPEILSTGLHFPKQGPEVPDSVTSAMVVNPGIILPPLLVSAPASTRTDTAGDNNQAHPPYVARCQRLYVIFYLHFLHPRCLRLALIIYYSVCSFTVH